MVHALEEAWRVLRSGGLLIDLRPVVSQPFVEVLASDGVFPAGCIDDSADRDDGIASDTALEYAIEQSWFRDLEHDSFHFAYYWDTTDEMFEYLAERWSEVVVPEEVISQVKELVSTAVPPIQLRIRVAMTITRYEKLGR